MSENGGADGRQENGSQADVHHQAGTLGDGSFLPALGSSAGTWFPRRESGRTAMNLQRRPWYRSQAERQFSPSDRDQPVIRTQPNPYEDVPSLYDLYRQVSKRSPVPQRFGTDVFQNGTGNYDRLPMDMPVGPDYVVGPGDGLSIEIWGSVSGRLQRAVDRQGLVMLPDSGAVQVAG